MTGLVPVRMPAGLGARRPASRFRSSQVWAIETISIVFALSVGTGRTGQRFRDGEPVWEVEIPPGN